MTLPSWASPLDASFPDQLVCVTCHSHPHWQRTESQGLNFFKSVLHTAHERIHINSSSFSVGLVGGDWGRHTVVIRLLRVCLPDGLLKASVSAEIVFGSDQAFALIAST